MTIIQLNRPKKYLKIAPTLADLKALHNTTKIWDVTHVGQTHTKYGWYDLYNGHIIAGLVTDVTEVKEKWGSK